MYSLMPNLIIICMMYAHKCTDTQIQIRTLIRMYSHMHTYVCLYTHSQLVTLMHAIKIFQHSCNSYVATYN